MQHMVQTSNMDPEVVHMQVAELGNKNLKVLYTEVAGLGCAEMLDRI